MSLATTVLMGCLIVSKDDAQLVLHSSQVGGFGSSGSNSTSPSSSSRKTVYPFSYRHPSVPHVRQQTKNSFFFKEDDGAPLISAVVVLLQGDLYCLASVGGGVTLAGPLPWLRFGWRTAGVLFLGLLQKELEVELLAGLFVPDRDTLEGGS